jgi:predicted DNA-binding WGR domain protein
MSSPLACPVPEEPGQGIGRFYSVMTERGLFGRIVLVRNWGRIGSNGCELVEKFVRRRNQGRPRA